jgi:alpha-aminoadipic semialdehyde synthase
MKNRIGIRIEDKNEWERRVPIVPADAASLIRDHGVEFSIQPMANRAFSDSEYINAGVKIDPALTDCSIVIGIKEMPEAFFEHGKTYVFFSHVIKGQKHNLPMLQKLIDLECNLLDYEKITDDKGVRLIFFGNEAGKAGMIDTLWALGQRLKKKKIDNPFTGVRQATGYRGLSDAEAAIEQIGNEITSKGIPDVLHPLTFGFAGAGNVSKGAQAILGLFPVIEITPEELLHPGPDTFKSKNHVYKIVFHEQHMAESVSDDSAFELQDYYHHPEKYKSAFPKYIPHLTVLMNCIFWNYTYPRLVTKNLIVDMYTNGDPKLVVIGDISIDIEGAIQVSVKVTNSGNPVYVYDIDLMAPFDGVVGNGPVILAVDNLPCELPRDSSTHFSSMLRDYIPNLAEADFSVDFDKLDLIPPLKRAMIVYHGNLTPDYKYIQGYIDEFNSTHIL